MIREISPSPYESRASEDLPPLLAGDGVCQHGGERAAPVHRCLGPVGRSGLFRGGPVELVPVVPEAQRDRERGRISEPFPAVIGSVEPANGSPVLPYLSRA